MRRINKRIARKLWDAGYEILFIPCKLRPDSMWGLGVTTSKLFWGNNSFDEYVRSCEYYNCNGETGRYLSYYVNDDVK